MQRTRGNHRKPSLLSRPMQEHLNSYALCATAAGVGMLALAHAAEARIIYTPADVQISRDSYPLDLNGDGITDFVVRQFTSSATSFMRVRPYQSKNLIWGIPGYPAYASALRAGVVIHANRKKLNAGSAIMCTIGLGGTFGDWINVQNRYLGLKFNVNGKAHYGWARLSTDNCEEATLTGYAYETVPNKSIVTGKTRGPDVITVQPAKLGHLARGASAIPSWRQKEQ